MAFLQTEAVQETEIFMKIFYLKKASYNQLKMDLKP
jgi:hypothetical protein